MIKSIGILLFVSATLYINNVDQFFESTFFGSIDIRPSAERHDDFQDETVTQDGAPKIAIEITGAPAHLGWNSQVRYTISVADPVDGLSKFGEIDGRACVMEIEYFPADAQSQVNDVIKTREEPKGLSLMRRSTCFGCHADKTRLAGPSFAEIAGRYENNAANIKELGAHVINGSSGIWGNQMMPSHPDLTGEQAGQIVDYILDQGRNKRRWIFPGLEGTFRTIEKPGDHDQGIYVLTASYTSTSNKRGEQSVVFKIK